MVDRHFSDIGEKLFHLMDISVLLAAAIIAIVIDGKQTIACSLQGNFNLYCYIISIKNR